MKAQCSLVRPVGDVNAIAKRCIATGDNNEVFIPSDAKFKEFQVDPDFIYWPPVYEGMYDETVVNTVEETKWDQPLADALDIHFGKWMPTIHDDDPTKNPERDVVNYPRPTSKLYPEGVRLLIFPDFWFRGLYHRTGVTGPYCLTFGVLTFLFSKEWLIYEHEMHSGVHLFILGAVILKKFGKQIGEYLDSVADAERYYWNRWQTESKEFCEHLIEYEKNSQESLKNQKILFDAKRENVQLQREAEYRRRLMTVYEELKRKLEFQIASQEAVKQFSQKHMVQWILDNVSKSLASVPEKETLNKCIADLKALSVARAGAI